jgi:uncharacterized cupin superfamily protein
MKNRISSTNTNKDEIAVLIWNKTDSEIRKIFRDTEECYITKNVIILREDIMILNTCFL